MAALMAVKAEDLPSQSPSPSPSIDETEEPDLPTPGNVPSNPEPGVLPESGELPAYPPAGMPARERSSEASPRRLSKEEGRFEEVRALAMGNPRAAYLLKRSKYSSNSASRRTYLRAYYVALASRMRKLDPKLRSSIDAYEQAKIREISGSSSTVGRSRSTHHSSLHRTASHSEHHRSHRLSYRSRHGRMIIMEGPYGPDFPLYGPPVVFDPW
jgi:hypothetical protein